MRLFRFKVYIDGLEDKIWREIVIDGDKSVADLAYTILATFNSLAYHLYNVKHNGKVYDCMVGKTKEELEENEYSAIDVKLEKMNFKKNKTMTMEYDYGTPTDFVIEVLNDDETEANEILFCPYIENGSGIGMLDDVSCDELKEIIEKIDKTGKCETPYSPGYEINEYYDYHGYNINIDNRILLQMFLGIKEGYEGIFDDEE